MHQRYRTRWNFEDKDWPFIQAFENYARRQGWSPREIETAYDFYKDLFKPGAAPMSPAEALDAFEGFAIAKGLSPHQVLGVRDFQAAVSSSGPQQFLPQHTREDDSQRAHYLEQLMKDPASVYYADKGLLTERMYPDPEAFVAALPEPVPTGEGSTLARLNLAGAAPEPSFQQRRIEQLESMMRDPKSDYYEGKNTAELKSEYRKLLGDPGPDTAPKLQIGRLQENMPPPVGTVIETD
jgi:hypothetical protein